MEKKERIIIRVRLDEKTFREFAIFDQLIRRRGWVKPAAFLGAFTFLAVIAFLSGREESGLLGGVLLLAGIGLPAVYFGTFFRQVHEQAVKQKLKLSREVYTVTLEQEGFSVENKQKKDEHLYLFWREEGLMAYRRRRCVYLYAGQSKAFLLPDNQAEVSGDEVWRFLEEHLGSRAVFCRYRDKKRRKVN